MQEAVDEQGFNTLCLQEVIDNKQCIHVGEDDPLNIRAILRKKGQNVKRQNDRS